MKAHLFIDLFGIEKANRVVENVVFEATYYCEKTGSYYSSKKNDAVEIKSLIQAIREYKSLVSAKSAYETRLTHWNKALNRAIVDHESTCQPKCEHGYDVACLICGFGTVDGERIYHNKGKTA